MHSTDNVQYLMFFCTRSLMPVTASITYLTLTDSYSSKNFFVRVLLPVTFTRLFSAEITYEVTLAGPVIRNNGGDTAVKAG